VALAIAGLNFLADAVAGRRVKDALFLANHPARKGLDSAGADKSSGLLRRHVDIRAGFRRARLVGGPQSSRSALAR
jgi:hypothetical protein